MVFIIMFIRALGVLKLGMNCFVNHSKNFKDRLPACEFVDLYSNSKMYLTASVDYRHPTQYKDSLPWGNTSALQVRGLHGNMAKQ